MRSIAYKYIICLSHSVFAWGGTGILGKEHCARDLLIPMYFWHF